MRIKVVCEDCGRDMGTSVVAKDRVTLTVHGCKCESAGFRRGFELGRQRAKEVFENKDDAGRV